MPNKVLGKGNTSEVLEYGTEKVCKLFYEGYPREYVQLEFRNAQVLNKEGLPVRRVYEIVEGNGRTGIVYERVYGQTLLEAF